VDRPGPVRWSWTGDKRSWFRSKSRLEDVVDVSSRPEVGKAGRAFGTAWQPGWWIGLASWVPWPPAVETGGRPEPYRREDASWDPARGAARSSEDQWVERPALTQSFESRSPDQILRDSTRAKSSRRASC